MQNPKSVKEVIKESKKIEENNFNNMIHLTSIQMLINSTDTGNSKDPHVSDTFRRLQEKIEDANALTAKLVSHLEDAHHEHDSLR